MRALAESDDGSTMIRKRFLATPRCGFSLFDGQASGYAPRMPSLVIDVRPGRASDAAELAEVYAAAWREAYSGIIPAITLQHMIARRSAPWWRDVLKRRSVLVLDVGGVVAGYATFAPAPTRGQPAAAEVQELYLRPEYQGIGLGARLFGAALKRVKARGYVRVLIRALAENERANAFYVRQGGKLVARTDESLGGRSLPCLWYEIRP
jgi:GNAT superfamily N-acetyltransferase